MVSIKVRHQVVKNITVFYAFLVVTSIFFLVFAILLADRGEIIGSIFLFILFVAQAVNASYADRMRRKGRL